ncbi:uncharacterized protein LOC125954885 [Anopheles darlingi]|uniref:uncharacterized protein LOC125954885 n=1 Tax=Anopheles darlingi TaxID=43151 RepID=UPI0021006766|nr:uncharacterized protein LOC125954885 [Anopheles darlingi]
MERKLLIVLCIIATSVAVCSALKVNVTNRQAVTFRSAGDGNIQRLPEEVVSGSSHTERKKRAVIFRPLFVYRQQEIKKQKLKEMRDQRQQQQQQPAKTNKQNAPTPVRFYAQNYPYQQG